MKKTQIVVIGIVFVFTCFFSCKKHNTDNTASNDLSLDTLHATLAIQDKGSAIVNDAIQTASTSSTVFDMNSVIGKIKAIDGVRNAIPTPSGTSLNIIKNDGSVCNILIFGQDDDRLIQKTTIKTIPTSVGAKINDIIPPIYTDNFSRVLFPTTTKAVILAPFQHDFSQHIDYVQNLLQDAGFIVTVLLDESVTADKLTGDYLSQFSIIYISTHGSADVAIDTEGHMSTAFLSGQKVTDASYKSISASNRAFLRTGSTPRDSKTSYYEITVPYLTHTLTRKFPNSWVFFDACESSTNTDLRDFFLNNGAIGFDGFKNTVITHFADCVGIELTALLTAGYDYDDATHDVKYNQGIYETTIDKVHNNVMSINDFTSKKIAVSTLFNLSSNANGYPSISPNSGFSGTPINLSFNLYYPIAHITLKTSYDYVGRPSTESTYLVPPSLPAKDPGNNGLFSYRGSNTIKVLSSFFYPRPELYRFSEVDSANNIRYIKSVPFTIHEY
jgi:hypothetical protein